MTKRCEYCTQAKPLVIGNSDDKGISLMYPNILSAYGYDIHGSNSDGLCVKINYCPMCGRLLNSDWGEVGVKQMTNGELITVEWTNEELITGLRHIAHTMERNGHSYYQHVAETAIKALEQTDKMFFISEILVRESKWEITPEKALNQIRDILMGYTFWDKESEDAE